MVEILEKVIAVRLTENEHQRIKNMCERAGVRMSDGIRWCIRESGALDVKDDSEKTHQTNE